MTDDLHEKPPAPPTRQGAIPDDADAPTSKMAIASLVLGVLGFCTVITAVLGFVLGVISFHRVRDSNGRLRGQGIAIAGMAVSGGALLTTIIAGVFGFALLLPAMGTARQAAEQARATAEARAAAQVMVEYHMKNQSAFPPADDWRTALIDNSEDDSGNPIVLPGGFSFNASLDGLHAYDIVDPARTVMLFETPSGSPISGGRELMADEPRHRGGFVIVFVDAHVETVPPELLDDLVWDVDDADNDDTQ